MRCRDVQRFCTSYVDGELDERRASALRGHIRTCDACCDRVADEAQIADAASDLEAMDPPAELWAGIEARIADAEIADGRRGRLWLWWQGVRERALPAAVGAVAVAVLVVWLVRDQSAEPVAGTSGPPGDVAERADEAAAELDRPEPAAVPSTFAEARRAELARADARYAKVIAELHELLDEDTGELPDEERLELDEQLTDLERAAERHRARLGANGSLDPADRRELYTIYRAEIALLRQATIAEVAR